uniref:Uncharacterized protein n=1 Tax=Candidatus Methanogaster sp. ANME-2c ERB4 TaxID=2759911 RepID=A0A7G9YK80_9EURY|nr:hypothetical protein DLCBDOIA_00007 [Methanosarcinales archaeon ANME-2c ERB4]QNO48499.1 hypothetical protein AFGHNAJH_00003 [Methanosarcinales archaeon ANME-2c ERB4]
MIRLDDLKAKTHQNLRSEGGEEIAIMLDSDAKVKAAIQGLIKYFGEDEDRKAVRLIVKGEESGWLTRSHIYDFVTFSAKGIGGGDDASIPGEYHYHIMHLYCPVEGCMEGFGVMIFDEDNPPKCPVHRDVSMVIKQ